MSCSKDEWYSHLNLELRAEFIQINKEDQRVRRGLKEKLDWDEKKRVDSINIKRLKGIISEFGFPSQKLIGQRYLDKERADIYGLSFHITHEEDLKFFEPLFLEYVKCGKSSFPTLYANLIDSNDMKKGRFTFGIYSNVEEEEIEDFENLDKRRISVGLSPWWLHKEIQRLLQEKYGF